MKLNERLSEHDIQFEPHADKLILIEKVPHRLNNLPSLKEELKQVYRLRFDWTSKYWFIGFDGMKKLSERQLKTQPSISETELKQKLSGYVQQIRNEPLKKCVERILKDKPFYCECPGAKWHHHSYKHGLLEHSIQVIELSFAITSTFKSGIRIDSDLLIAGALLHDIGKINCYKFIDGGIDVCPLISEQDHIVNGIKLVSQYVQCDLVQELLLSVRLSVLQTA